MQFFNIQLLLQTGFLICLKKTEAQIVLHKKYVDTVMLLLFWRVVQSMKL